MPTPDHDRPWLADLDLDGPVGAPDAEGLLEGRTVSLEQVTRAKLAAAIAEGDRLGDAFRARTASMEHVPGCGCGACRPVSAQTARASDRPGNASCDEISAVAKSEEDSLRAPSEHPCCRGIGGHEAWCMSGPALAARYHFGDLPGAEARPEDRHNNEQNRDLESQNGGPEDPPCPDPACACPSCTAAYHETLRRFAASLEPLPLIRPRHGDPGAAGRAEPPCCARVGSSWCVLAQKHAGEHVPGAPERELPVFTFERGRRQ